MNHHTQRSAQSGFTMIEALITMVITAFGLLALSGIQIKLSREGDVAKQRTEATRLAQEKIEQLRAFTGLTAGTINWATLASSPISDSITPSNYLTGSTNGTNTTYARTWNFSGAVADNMRPVSVTVAWTDRANNAQSVTLSTVISKTDPADTGYLNFPLPQNTNLKLPLDRNINIPVPAIDLGSGKSALRLATGLTVVFSDVSGGVVEKCTGTVSVASYNAETAGCSTHNAVLLTGYVSGSKVTTTVSGNPTPGEPNDVAAMPTGINTSAIEYDSSGGKTISCVYRVASDQTSGAEIPDYHYYACVIPIASEGSWRGKLKLGGVTTGSDNFKVCRFQYNTVDIDGEYEGVTTSMGSQNYYVANSSGNSCPTINSVTTLLHQDCRNSGAPTTGASGACPATAHNRGL